MACDTVDDEQDLTTALGDEQDSVSDVVVDSNLIQNFIHRLKLNKTQCLTVWLERKWTQSPTLR